MKGILAVAALLPLLSPALRAQGFQSVIDTWVAQDALDPPPANALLFVGSSSIRKWERLQYDFSRYDVIQRGFGGSTMEDLNQYLDEIVLAYDPYAIVLYSGANSIVTSGATPADEFARYVTFVDTIHAQQSQSRPPIPIFFIGITPAPARWSFWPQFSLLNDMLEEYADSDASLHYIDTPAAFLATGSPPAANRFAPDGVHLNEAGYALWTSVIGPQVNTLVPSPKVYVNNPSALFPGEKFLFDLGVSDAPNSLHTASPDANGNHWNCWPDVGGQSILVAGQHTGNLVTTTGRATGIDLVLGGGFMAGGIANGGLLAPSPTLLGNFAIETATQDYLACINLSTPLTPGSEFDEPGFLVLNNLSRNLRYNVRLFASRSSSTAQTTRYAVRGHPTSAKVGQLLVGGPGSGTTGNQNDDTIVTLNGLRANTWGQLFIDVALVGPGFAYISVLEVSAHLPPL